MDATVDQHREIFTEPESLEMIVRDEHGSGANPRSSCGSSPSRRAQVAGSSPASGSSAKASRPYQEGKTPHPQPRVAIAASC